MSELEKKAPELDPAEALVGAEGWGGVQDGGDVLITALMLLTYIEGGIGSAAFRTLIDAADTVALRSALELTDRRFITPTNGGTTAIADSTSREIIVYLNHASTIASHTFTLPVLLDGQKISFRAKAAISAATITPASGSMLGTISSFTANGHVTWEWVDSLGELWRGE